MTTKFIISTALATMLLSACETTSIGPKPGFGDATAHNRAVQEVLPTQAQKNNTFIPADAKRQSDARQAYRDNDVIEPEPIATR